MDRDLREWEERGKASSPGMLDGLETSTHNGCMQLIDHVPNMLSSKYHSHSNWHAIVVSLNLASLSNPH